MFRHQVLTALAILAYSASSAAADFSGASALEFTRQAVAFGPRPPGSPANQKLQAFIESQLKLLHCQISFDAFKVHMLGDPSREPRGIREVIDAPMRNIIAKFPGSGSTGRAIVITGHFDTKPMPAFLGANDGGSSTGLLLELARSVNTMIHSDDIYLVFFDGEEAFGEWSATNGTFGSRHLAARWASEGFLPRIKALINVDMIGDKDLGILQETMSSPQLLRTVWQTAHDLGYGKYFLNSAEATEDDHLPFLQKGVNALDLIDFDYGPNNAYWHTPEDTMDKLSAHSFDVVGNVLIAVIRKL
jgi:glutaminyl-peptide cyclotransferase